jgi:hypothetical protein
MDLAALWLLVVAEETEQQTARQYGSNTEVTRVTELVGHYLNIKVSFQLQTHKASNTWTSWSLNPLYQLRSMPNSLKHKNWTFT